MLPGTPNDEDAWVTLSIFYVRRPRLDADPPDVVSCAEVLYGEGALAPGPGEPTVRTENLGNGLRVLRVSNTLAVVAETLLRPHYDHRIDNDRKRVERFFFGFTRRPIVLGVAERVGIISSPMNGGFRIHQFVRVDKSSLLQRIASEEEDSERARTRREELFDALATLAGRDFRGDHTRWLGDVVIAERRARRVAWWTCVASADGTSCRAIDVHVDPKARGRIHIHVRAAGVDEMCIYDRLLEWDAGVRDVRRIEFVEELGSVFLRGWLESALILEELSAVLRGFDGRVELIGGAYTIQDRLTQKLSAVARGKSAEQGVVKATQSGQMTALTTRISSSMRSEPWEGANATGDAIFDLLGPRAPDYAHFPVGAEGRATAVLHFAKLLKQSDQAYLIDPWFDVVGAEALVTRLSGDVKLTVLTNLPFGEGEHVEQSRRLADFLRAAAVMGLPENLKVICLTATPVERQLFHDRVVLLRKGGRWTGYVLTNSFSGLATQFPLFAVETPAGTTALLLREFERLTDPDFATAKQVWPTVGAPMTPRPRDGGEFLYWRLVLLGLVPRNGAGERSWLQRAERKGFVISTGDGLKWMMKPDARETALTWLLNGPRASRLRRPRALRRRTVHVDRVRLPFGSGIAVMLIGDLAARGMDVSADDVARRLGAARISELERALEGTFADDPNPRNLRAGMSRFRIQLRQNLTGELARAEAMEFGLHLWDGRYMQTGEPTRWGRCFAYAVLGCLAPERAVGLCERLLDADLVLVLVGFLQRGFAVWSPQLAIALARSRSPLLRVLGIESLAHGSFGPFRSSLANLDEVRAAIARIGEAGVGENDILCHLTMWALRGAAENRGAAVAFRELVPKVSHRSVEDAVHSMLAGAMAAEPFLEVVIEQLIEDGSERATSALDAAVRRFAQRFATPLSAVLYFNVSIHMRLTIIMARALAFLASKRASQVASEIKKLMPVDEIEAAIAPLTPFRRREGAALADVALGWVTLWELLASCGPPTEHGGVPVPAEVVARVQTYLASRDLGQSGELRRVLMEMLGPAAGG
jgi:hypothetical protein